MKRFLQTFLCALMLFVCGAAAQATPITIQSQQVPDFRFTGANLTLRSFLNDRGFISWQMMACLSMKTSSQSSAPGAGR